jgi:hypothetical protein
MPHTLIIPDETRVRLVEYLAGLQAGSASAGKRLRDNLAGIELVTLADCRLNREGYYGLYERRLLPVFQHVNDSASVQGKQALLTIPGLGCGQFAGPFAGQLGTELKMVLERFLTLHGASFPQIKAVYFDPYSQCSNSRQEIHGISLMVRPLLQGNAGKSQLCQPSAYAEASDDFSDCILFSIVAWDHVSWPGNDYFGGSRCTDDGVKAAATSSPSASAPSWTSRLRPTGWLPMKDCWQNWRRRPAHRSAGFPCRSTTWESPRAAKPCRRS